MTTALPHVREVGSGAGVVCLHANASSSAQWRALIDRLAPRCHVLAPDLYGAGKSPEWPSRATISLADEVALIAPVLAAGRHAADADRPLVRRCCRPARGTRRAGPRARARPLRADPVRPRRRGDAEAQRHRGHPSRRRRRRPRSRCRRSGCGRRALHRLLDGIGQLAAHARAAPGADRRGDRQRTPLAPCPRQRADAGRGFAP